MRPSTTAMRFVDTNVLIYAASPSPDEAGKRRRAQKLLRDGDLALSVQVLQEFYWQATHRRRGDALTPSQALGFIDSIRDFPVQAITQDVFRNAVALSRRFQIAYWDAAILAAAQASGCDAVYSEDLSHEQDYGGIRVIDPFGEAARR